MICDAQQCRQCHLLPEVCKIFSEVDFGAAADICKRAAPESILQTWVVLPKVLPLKALRSVRSVFSS